MAEQVRAVICTGRGGGGEGHGRASKSRDMHRERRKRRSKEQSIAEHVRAVTCTGRGEDMQSQRYARAHCTSSEWGKAIGDRDSDVEKIQRTPSLHYTGYLVQTVCQFRTMK